MRTNTKAPQRKKLNPASGNKLQPRGKLVPAKLGASKIKKK